MRNAFIKELTEVAGKNKKIILLTGDLGFTVFEDFAHKYPDRFFNMGAAEANMMGVATGLALSGLIPIVYSIATFATMRGFEQIRGDVCFHNANVKIIGSGGGLSYGHAGFSHHSLEDIAIMRAIPNMTIVCSSDPISVRKAIAKIIIHDGPVYLRLGKKGEPDIYSEKLDFQIGKGNILKEGKHAVIIATGNLVKNALIASDILLKKGIACGVVDMHTIKPLDTKLIDHLIEKYKTIVTLEEHHIIGGLGSAVAEVIAEGNSTNLHFKRLGIPDIFIEKIGSQKYLRHIYNLDPEGISRSIFSLIN